MITTPVLNNTVFTTGRVSTLEGGIVECGEGFQPGSRGVGGAAVWKSVPETSGSVFEQAEPGLDEGAISPRFTLILTA
jgi:hypothetical protein